MQVGIDNSTSSWVRPLPELRGHIMCHWRGSLIGLLAEICVQAGPLGRLPDYTRLLAVFHGQVRPLAVLCNHLWSNLQALLHGSVVPLIGLQGGRAMGWNSKLLHVESSLRLCSPVKRCHWLNSVFRWGCRHDCMVEWKLKQYFAIR